MKNYHIVSIALIAGLMIGCAIPAKASVGSCRSLHFTSAANQYHGEEINTGKEVLPVDEMLCDSNDGTAVLSWSIQGMNQQETLIKQSEGVYTKVATPANSSKVTTVIVYHFGKDGSFNYTKSVNGIAPIEGRNGAVSFNSVSFAVGEWYY